MFIMKNIKASSIIFLALLFLSFNVQGQSWKSNISSINLTKSYGVFEVDNITKVAVEDRLINLDQSGNKIDDVQVSWQSRRILMLDGLFFNIYASANGTILIDTYTLEGNFVETLDLGHNEYTVYDAEIIDQETFAMLLYKGDTFEMFIKKFDLTGSEMESQKLGSSGTNPREIYSGNQGSIFCYDQSNQRNLVKLDSELNIEFNGQIPDRIPTHLVQSDDGRIYTVGTYADFNNTSYINEIDEQGNILNEVVLNDSLSCGPDCYPYGLVTRDNKIGLLFGQIELLQTASFLCFDLDLSMESSLYLELNETDNDIFSFGYFARPIVNGTGGFSFGYAKLIQGGLVEPVVYRLGDDCNYETNLTSTKQAELLTTDLLSFKPNPVSDYLTIDLDEDVDNLEIINLSGQRVLSIETNGNKHLEVDLEALASGAYIIKYLYKDQVQTKRMIKK